VVLKINGGQAGFFWPGGGFGGNGPIFRRKAGFAFSSAGGVLAGRGPVFQRKAGLAF
jgi:hypothetical protein